MNWYKLSYLKNLPNLRTRDLVRFLQKSGFVFHRQDGSHQIWKHPDGRMVVVPEHPGDLDKGLLSRIVKKMLNMSVPQFQQAYLAM